MRGCCGPPQEHPVLYCGVGSVQTNLPHSMGTAYQTRRVSGSKRDQLVHAGLVAGKNGSFRRKKLKLVFHAECKIFSQSSDEEEVY
mmetsp:Transcript_27170/g.58607  ORF Transcript_27170/g.58607 Transcript_27170/m.58607 type:complete len:86 (+) Transcript_27170:48-305(+)